MARPGSGDRSARGIAATQLGFQPPPDSAGHGANAEIAWPAFGDYRDWAWAQLGFRGVGGHGPFGIPPSRPTEAIQEWPKADRKVNGEQGAIEFRCALDNPT